MYLVFFVVADGKIGCFLIAVATNIWSENVGQVIFQI